MKYTVYIPFVATLFFSCHTIPGTEETRQQQSAPTTVFNPPVVLPVSTPDSSTFAYPPQVYVFVLPPGTQTNASKAEANEDDWFDRVLHLLRLLLAIVLGIQLLRTARRSRSLVQLLKKMFHLLSEHDESDSGKS